MRVTFEAVTRPWAEAAPGRARIRVARLAGREVGAPAVLPPAAPAGRTTTAAAEAAAVEVPSAPRTASVRMNVPATSAAPIAIVTAVRISRSRLASRLATVRRSMSRPPFPHRAQFFHRIQDAVTGRVREFPREGAVGEEDHPVGVA